MPSLKNSQNYWRVQTVPKPKSISSISNNMKFILKTMDLMIKEKQRFVAQEQIKKWLAKDQIHQVVLRRKYLIIILCYKENTRKWTTTKLYTVKIMKNNFSQKVLNSLRLVLVWIITYLLLIKSLVTRHQYMEQTLSLCMLLSKTNFSLRCIKLTLSQT
jgi:hypothetical protein